MLKDYCLLGLVIGMFVVGGFIALRSGIAGTKLSRTMDVYVSNLWAMAVRLIGYVAALLALQQLLGTPHLLAW